MCVACVCVSPVCACVGSRPVLFVCARRWRLRGRWVPVARHKVLEVQVPVLVLVLVLVVCLSTVSAMEVVRASWCWGDHGGERRVPGVGAGERVGSLCRASQWGGVRCDRGNCGTISASHSSTTLSFVTTFLLLLRLLPLLSTAAARASTSGTFVRGCFAGQVTAC